ncbi:DUF2125 domain-containing protein [Octadecabacter sp. G9-8]|uniref:DUF2125 domain-containing protein n=1 Tax=Octadecabacter dasysiphoniae TaxID=2909341 RepID=A0ABS9CVR0_9RHOB|nr:DUF2125 domain-containing protein [Octadecabacter dasysiphoniae]MCF2871347.1 DUF2125 domain-containing protein [Octadecabacter dasysiphoniae]
MKIRLATSFIALSTAFAVPAFADVTAADVLSNQKAFYSALGVSLSGELSGDTFSNPEMNIVFPQGVASMQVMINGDVTMADNGDGSVLITYPSPMTLSVSGGAEDEGSFSVDMTMTHDGYSVLASGDPGEITYIADAQNLRFDVTNAQADGPNADEFEIEGAFTMDFWTGTSTVTEGNLINYTSTSEVGNSGADFTYTIDNVVSKSTQNTQPVQSNIDMMLPVGGSDVMNLSAALRNGLSIALETTGAASTSVSETTLNGEVMNRQATSTGPQIAALTVNEDGLAATAEAADFAMTFNDQTLFPGDLDFAMDQISANYDVPLNASDDPQDFRIATSMQGLTLGDTIWGLFDPAGILPRDPAEVSFDVTGNGTNGTDFLDFAAMAQMFGPPAVEIDNVTIENLRIAAVGAEATAKGAMTFDWTDFQTIPGIARPEGKVTVNLNGANALMDNLVAMGLIPEEELMMPRMMMGMFATPVGDDMLETVLEVNSEGHVLANGQRLQ